MAPKMVPVLLLSLTVIVCAAQSPVPATAPAVAPATRPGEALVGLQSLTRVQLKLTDVTEAVREEVVKQFREQLPELHTAGSGDDWTLEFVSGVASVEQGAKISTGRTPMVPVMSLRCRLSKTVVVDGRSAMAVAYEGPAATERPPPDARFAEFARPLDLKTLMLGAISGFVKDWWEANPKAKTK